MNLIIDRTQQNRFDDETLNFLSLITSDRNSVPPAFYTMFELKRVIIRDEEIDDLTMNQKKMILLCYILIKRIYKNPFFHHINPFPFSTREGVEEFLETS